MTEINDREHVIPRYTAIGDSLTVGYGSGVFTPGFVYRYAADAEKALGSPVYVDKIARIGATSGEILHAFCVPAVIDSVQASEIITITAGANDLIDAGEAFLISGDEALLFHALNRATTNIKKMIDRVNALHNPDRYLYILRLLNLYNPFPNIPQAELWIGQFNDHLAGFAKYPHIKVADIHSAFAGRQHQLLTPGGIHPNDRGYALMAEVLEQLGYAPLTPR